MSKILIFAAGTVLGAILGAVSVGLAEGTKQGMADIKKSEEDVEGW